MSKDEELLVITAYGKDRPGLVKQITSVLGENGVNIVDIEARIMRGLFIIFLIVDLSTGSISKVDLIKKFDELSNKIDFVINIEPYIEGRRKALSKLLPFQKGARGFAELAKETMIRSCLISSISHS